jgi:hypothetical protein
MNWELSTRVRLDTGAIPPADARRQERTARAILSRFDELPGVVLADAVGMGKTFVALAVAVSVIESTGGRRPVVVMVPPSVRGKWPQEWRKFEEGLLPGNPVRAIETSLTSAADFLRLLDDPAPTRKQLIFLTHGALTNALSDPLVKLALVRRALRAHRLEAERRRFPRWAANVIPGLRTAHVPVSDPDVVAALLEAPPPRWRRVIQRETGRDFGDDPVPAAVSGSLPRLNTTELAEVLTQLPFRTSPSVERRLRDVRRELNQEVGELWASCLAQLDLDLPLLILDEAHHAKNRATRLAGLFANESAERESRALRGALGGVFDRMLFLTATPFQLGHQELIEVLQRFEGVRWDDLERDAFARRLRRLREALDSAQAGTLRLDRAWARLRPAELVGLDDWWERPDDPALAEPLRAAGAVWNEARRRVRVAERELRPLVIRHARADADARRDVRCGAAMVEEARTGGLLLGADAVLPFLLAARAQAITERSDEARAGRARRFFADGLASSFEAYRQTRSSAGGNGSVLDDVDEYNASDGSEGDVLWYLDRIEAALPLEGGDAFSAHPKLRATVNRVTSLWRQREKALVFCFYRATGRALRAHIARSIEHEIDAMAIKAAGVGTSEAARARLATYQDRLYEPGSRAREAAERELQTTLAESLADTDLNRAIDLCLRFLRTSSFLVRYVDLARRPAEGILGAFEQRDASGRTFRDEVRALGAFLADREESERRRFLDALAAIEVGDIAVRDDVGEPMPLIANVRLANGSVRHEDRERLLAAFNTPFFPEVLVASSVMAEGVDLHLCCRHVIHHDLDWNPSVIEQRTGRLDRLGSKAEIAKLPIEVDEPYIEGAQDERQFRVMKDRERWFSIVMGERLELDADAARSLEERVPLPDRAGRPLMMNLALRRKGA